MEALRFSVLFMITMTNTAVTALLYSFWFDAEYYRLCYDRRARFADLQRYRGREIDYKLGETVCATLARALSQLTLFQRMAPWAAGSTSIGLIVATWLFQVDLIGRFALFGSLIMFAAVFIPSAIEWFDEYRIRKESGIKGLQEFCRKHRRTPYGERSFKELIRH